MHCAHHILCISQLAFLWCNFFVENSCYITQLQYYVPRIYRADNAKKKIENRSEHKLNERLCGAQARIGKIVGGNFVFGYFL